MSFLAPSLTQCFSEDIDFDNEYDDSIYPFTLTPYRDDLVEFKLAQSEIQVKPQQQEQSEAQIGFHKHIYSEILHETSISQTTQTQTIREIDEPQEYFSLRLQVSQDIFSDETQVYNANIAKDELVCAINQLNLVTKESKRNICELVNNLFKFCE